MKQNMTTILKKLEKTLTLEVKSGDKSPRTKDEYMKVARRLFQGAFTAENIPSRSRWLQISAVISYMKDLKLIEEGETFGLPIRALKRRFKKAQNRIKKIESKILPEVQFQELLSALPATSQGKELKLACEISRRCGARMQEVLALTSKNLDYLSEQDVIRVKIKEGKRDKYREVFLPGAFWHVLENFQGFSINRNYVATVTRRTMQRLGISSSFHGLRHSFATECIQEGMDIKTLSKLLGHKSIATTGIYLDVNTECPESLLNLWKKKKGE